PDFSRALAVSGRRHDFIAIHIRDEREKVFQTLASSRWKMPRPANRLRSIPPIAGRAGALANWSTNTKPIFRARSGGITSTRSRSRQEGIICQRSARSSNNANAVYLFGE